MKITILSKFGSCLDLAIKLQAEDNDVTLYTLTSDDSDIGKGIVLIKTSLGGLNADLIINDDVFLGETSDKLRKLGKIVVGGSSITDRLENDREFGYNIMKACGIKVPKSEKFTDFDTGIAFVKKNVGVRYIFKPHNQKDRFFTHIPESMDEMVVILEHYKDLWGNSKVTFELQEFIYGIEMSVGGWFNGEKFCKQVMPNFKYDKLMNGDIGPNMGKIGAVLCYRTHSKLYQETLAKAEAFLKTTGYRGFIDIACIATKDGTYGLEWTTRFGYPTIQVQDEVHKKGSWTKFLFQLAQGLTDEVPVDTSKWDVGVTVGTLPLTHRNGVDKFENTPIFLPKDTSHIHFDCVWLDEQQYYQAGSQGCVCVCTGSEITIEKAKEKAYQVLDTVHIPNGFFRTDIADRVMTDLPTLRSWGLIK